MPLFGGMDDEIRDAMGELQRGIEEALIGPVHESRSAVLDQIQRTVMDLTGQPCIARWDADGNISLTGPVFNYEVIYR